MFINARSSHIGPFDNKHLLCSLANLSLTISNILSISVVQNLLSVNLSRHPRMIFQRTSMNFTTFCFPSETFLVSDFFLLSLSFVCHHEEHGCPKSSKLRVDQNKQLLRGTEPSVVKQLARERWLLYSAIFLLNNEYLFPVLHPGLFSSSNGSPKDLPPISDFIGSFN